MGKRDFWEQVDLPGECMPGQVLIEIAGKNRVLVENHRGVREYGPEQIGVAVKYGWVQISGSGLELRYMSHHQLVITGSIESIVLNRRDGD